jgi:hypothetical protein
VGRSVVSADARGAAPPGLGVASSHRTASSTIRQRERHQSCCARAPPEAREASARCLATSGAGEVGTVLREGGDAHAHVEGRCTPPRRRCAARCLNTRRRHTWPPCLPSREAGTYSSSSSTRAEHVRGPNGTEHALDASTRASRPRRTRDAAPSGGSTGDGRQREAAPVAPRLSISRPATSTK